MSWFFPAFFGVLALCAALYLILFVIDRLAPRAECDAVVEKRYTETFPMTMGFVKRDRQEKRLTFRTEDGKRLDFAASEDVYKLCPSGTKGHLYYQGRRLVRFDAAELPDQEEIIF